MWYEQLATIAIWAYVVWMIPSGRTFWHCRLDHPNRVGFTNARPVFRDEEPGTYWGVIVFHFAIVAGMTYIAFFK